MLGLAFGDADRGILTAGLVLWWYRALPPPSVPPYRMPFRPSVKFKHDSVPPCRLGVIGSEHIDRSLEHPADRYPLLTPF